MFFQSWSPGCVFKKSPKILILGNNFEPVGISKWNLKWMEKRYFQVNLEELKNIASQGAIECFLKVGQLGCVLKKIAKNAFKIWIHLKLYKCIVLTSLCKKFAHICRLSLLVEEIFKLKVFWFLFLSCLFGLFPVLLAY